MSSDAKTIAIIVAAGRGVRAGEGGPKQYRQLAGDTVLARAARAFIDHPEIDAVRAIIHADDRGLYDGAIGALAAHRKLRDPILGGSQRQDSVRVGLESFERDRPETALIHDARVLSWTRRRFRA